MQISPYLMFNGTCEAAFHFYEKAVGGMIHSFSRYEGSPMSEQMPPDWSTKIIHGRISIGSNLIMGSDAPPGRYAAPQGVHLSIEAPSPEEAKRIFEALSENGKVEMPLQETFWARAFGMLTDQFGIPWMVDCEKPH